MVKGQQRLWILRTMSSFRHDIRSLRREGHDGRNSTADEPVRPDANHHIRQHKRVCATGATRTSSSALNSARIDLSSAPDKE